MMECVVFIFSVIGWDCLIAPALFKSRWKKRFREHLLKTHLMRNFIVIQPNKQKNWIVNSQMETRLRLTLFLRYKGRREHNSVSGRLRPEAIRAENRKVTPRFLSISNQHEADCAAIFNRRLNNSFKVW